MCSYKLNRAIGAHLAKHAQGQRGILKSAYEKGCSGLCAGIFAIRSWDLIRIDNRSAIEGRPRFRFDPFEDLEHFAATLLRRKGWEFSRSGAACLATGRSSLAHSSNCVIAGAGKSPAEALSLWPAYLSGAGVLGRIVGQSLQRSDLVGQVRASGGRREIRRSLRGRHSRLADHCRCRFGAPRQGEKGRQRTQGRKSHREKVGTGRPFKSERGRPSRVLPNSQTKPRPP